MFTSIFNKYYSKNIGVDININIKVCHYIHTVMEGFQDNIKKWVALDTQLKILNDKTKELRTERNDLTDGIMEFVADNNLSSSTIKISDGRLKFNQTKQTAPITLGFLETCLMDLFNSEEKVQQVMNYIKEKREVKVVTDIKRYYNN